ncbi:MAG TPA: YajQ family cyclic di-GMP-binding protein [Mariprofundaceae bacterium]|nr:YajQ family cyclic di-GMP-binding protein [Mariprofundaceae bacterium]
MPSFDVVSETDMQEVDNAINQVKKEIMTRYDFKGSRASIERNDAVITVIADDQYKLGAIHELLKARVVRRGLDPKCLDFATAERASGDTLRQTITVKQGVDKELGKQITREIKDSKLKVQSSIQGEMVRITGKSRDDLQAAMALIRGIEADRPLSFTNLRD